MPHHHRLSLLIATLLWVQILAAEGLDWQAGNGFKRAPVTVASETRVGFTRLGSNHTGILFTNLLDEKHHLTNQVLLNGSGVAAGDVDGDGLCDLFFCGLGISNALYRNLGDWKFEEITQKAGLRDAGLHSTGAVLFDVDGDGDLDLAFNTVGNGTRFFANDGRGNFTPIVRLNDGQAGMSFAVADINGDGFLDVYITNYRPSALMDMPNARAWFKRVDGRMIVERIDGRYTTAPDLTNRFIVDVRGGVTELGQPDLLVHNLGGTNLNPGSLTDGTFADEEGRPLRKPDYGWGLAAMFRDVNGDRLPDLYVCNDFESEDRFWLNSGGGRFRAAPTLSLRKTSWFSMGMDFADVNRDGHDDFLVLDMLSRDHRNRMVQISDPTAPSLAANRIEDRPQYGINTLFLNRGDGTYAEISQLSGVDASEWSWTAIFIDVDLDGWEDLLVSNGQERAARDLDVVEQLKQMRASRKMSDAEIFEARRLFPKLNTANLAFRNRGDLTFEEVGAPWGFNDAGVSHGMALADLDNDGDCDVVINNFNNAPGIYRNDTTAARIAVRLKGRPPNTRGIGARIIVNGGPVPQQTQEMISGGRYLSSDDSIRVFAGGNSKALNIEVLWPSGLKSRIDAAEPNRIYEIEEPGGQTGAQDVTPKLDPPTPPIFEDVSRLLSHSHSDEPFDDFSRQPLLPNRLSELGPGIAWCDLDADGWDDLVIAGGKGGPLAAFRNQSGNRFERITGPPFSQPVTRDQTTVLPLMGSAGVALLAGSANYEDGLALGSAVRQFDLATKRVDDSLPATNSSTGPMALADIDGDGDLDLFVGGRVIPGRYPAPPSSRLFKNENGKFMRDPGNSAALQQVGMVTGAVFSDLDNDSDPDLVLTCEWGPIVILRNNNGRFERWNPPVELSANTGADALSRSQSVGLDALKGWWTGVATGDFNGDGLMDIVAGNWGRNTKYERYRAQPLRIYYAESSNATITATIEAHDEAGMYAPERQMTALLHALPQLRERFPTHRQFAEASVEQILDDRTNSVSFLEATWLDATLFLNRGGRFEARPLPIEAQFSPVFGLAIADYDGDGFEDLFVSQNSFSAQSETPRYDAGRGLLLLGNGRGDLRSVPGQQSGITVYGGQRGCAAADFDHDGRVDLVVTQNGAETKLYRNREGRPGLRIRLRGPAANSSGIGAMVRVQEGGKLGPAREIQGGSGYWSYNSPTQVRHGRERIDAVWVRWPDGKITEAAVPEGATELEIPNNAN